METNYYTAKNSTTLTPAWSSPVGAGADRNGITMPELSTVTQKGQVTIPIAIRQYWGLKPQQRVVFIEKDYAVEIKPAVDFFDLKGSIKTKRKYLDKTVNKAIGKHLAKQYIKTN